MLDLIHLRRFVAVAQPRSFTLASQKLGVGQSTVSQHLQHLEKEVGRRLLDRDTHGVRLTAKGEALPPHARQMLALERQAASLFEAGLPRGPLRFGISEDPVTGQLPGLLQDFIPDYPAVELHPTAALSKDLADMHDRGVLNLVSARRRLGDRRGEPVLREPLVWFASDPATSLARPILPLIVFPPPSPTRTLLMQAPERHGTSWRIVCSCHSLSSLTAAAPGGMTSCRNSAISPRTACGNFPQRRFRPSRMSNSCSFLPRPLIATRWPH